MNAVQGVATAELERSQGFSWCHAREHPHRPAGAGISVSGTLESPAEVLSPAAGAVFRYVPGGQVPWSTPNMCSAGCHLLTGKQAEGVRMAGWQLSTCDAAPICVRHRRDGVTVTTR